MDMTRLPEFGDGTHVPSRTRDGTRLPSGSESPKCWYVPFCCFLLFPKAQIFWYIPNFGTYQNCCFLDFLHLVYKMLYIYIYIYI